MDQSLQLADTTQKSLVFGTDDPVGIISKATAIANSLTPLVEKAKLYNMIQGKKYVRAEGWTTMAAMLGVFPQTEYCRKIDREGEIAYEARIVLKHVSGLVVGAGEAFCSDKEPSNRTQEYAIASMAQTRAVGKACRLSFSWIMSLSGYESTPAEEMIAESYSVPKTTFYAPKTDNSRPVSYRHITAKQRGLLFGKAMEYGISTDDLKTIVFRIHGRDTTSDLNTDELTQILEEMKTNQKIKQQSVEEVPMNPLDAPGDAIE